MFFLTVSAANFIYTVFILQVGKGEWFPCVVHVEEGLKPWEQ